MKKLFITIYFLLFACGCASEGGSLNQIELGLVGVPDTQFTIYKESQLIGGPLAEGRIGDVLLENDKIRVIIQKPGKLAWVTNFGGSIIDADIKREGPGIDNFGFMHPLINVEWTVNVYDYEVIKNGADGGSKVFRTYGVIDTYDYLDIDFIAPVAKAMTDQILYYAPRFDDINAPFELTDLKYLNTHIITEYTLEPGKNYVRIETTFENMGDDEISFPVGDYVNGSGEVMFLIPGIGFTPELMPQIQGDTPALIYTAFEGSDVSYGYFYDLSQFVETDEEGNSKRLKSTSLSYSGITGLFYGEDFLKVLPLGGKSQPKVNFKVPANSERSITRYFVVGNGNAGTVFDAGLQAINIKTNTVSGVVKDSKGSLVAGATVAVKNEADSTIITYRTDSDGKFEGELSTGSNEIDKAFGTGVYSLGVYKKGYQVASEKVSGTCTPETVDVTASSVTEIECVLGETGVVVLNEGVFDQDTGEKIPARLTIVGYVPSYRSDTGGHFEDEIIFERPLGVVDVYYVNAKGTIGIEEFDSIRVAPGNYEFVFTRGVEYSMERIPVTVTSSYAAAIGPVQLKKVIDTSGYVSGDFHLHTIVSPDSAMRPERRVLTASAEGMDFIQSTDHDYLQSYKSHVEALSSSGLIPEESLIPIVGQEISPNHMGHFNIFPLQYSDDILGGGAIDWSASPKDVDGPGPDFVMSPREIVQYARSLPEDPIIQINHISDQPTSLLLLSGWVTSPYYFESFGVEPLSSYGEPVLLRLEPKVSANNYPYPYGTSDLVVTDFDTIELVIGPELHDDYLLTSALPQWFNLLNLGIIATATGDSDSHREIADPLGAPRNFIALSQDPADGLNNSSGFSIDEYKENIRNHKVIVSAGPFIRIDATSENGETMHVGDTIVGSNINLNINITSPDWAWFDTVEIYTNTEPVPASDDTYIPLEGKAKNPAEFYEPYHIPRYYYEADYSFRLNDHTLTDWKNEEGVITANVNLDLTLDEDTWIVVFVKGTEETEGYFSLFPFVTRALIDADNPSAEPENVDIGNIKMLTKTGAPAWAFANPIFVDIDGNGFDAKYSKEWNFNSEKSISKSKSEKPVNESSKINIPNKATLMNADLL